MTIGQLMVTAKLDKPNKVHYGDSEPVECHAAVTYYPKLKKNEEPQDLFGPLKIAVCFHGRAKTKIVISSGQSRRVYRWEIPLFSMTAVVYNDSFQSRPGQTQMIPFLLTFPKTDSARIVPGDMGNPGALFATTNGPLPPSVEYETSAVKTYVKYQVKMFASMPGLPLDMQFQNEYAQPCIRYDRPRVMSPSQQQLALRGGELLRLQDESLLHADERPQGFLQKTKTLFASNSLPCVLYNWTVTTLSELHIGRPIVLDVSLREEQNNAHEAPVVLLLIPEVKVKSRIYVRVTKQLFSTPSKDHDAWAYTLQASGVDQKPFSKENNWTKRFITQPVPYMPSMFGTYNVALNYRISITLVFKINEKVFQRKVRANIPLQPPVMSSELPGSSTTQRFLATGSFGAGEGSSSSAAADATLPSYNEASNGISDQAPQYDESTRVPQPLEKRPRDDCAFNDEGDSDDDDSAN